MERSAFKRPLAGALVVPFCFAAIGALTFVFGLYCGASLILHWITAALNPLAFAP
jgi:hypothetical protein